MKFVAVGALPVVVLLASACAPAAQLPSASPAPAPSRGSPDPVPVSARDRVYTADQVSNTVSVIDPSTNRLLGVIRLGNARPDVLSPLYDGEVNVHGMGVSPDGRTLDVISTATNSVTLLDAATNAVRGTVYLERNPHEGFFTPDGRELWVTIRGESHIAVLDPGAMRVVARVPTAPGPGMVVFRPDGRVAFVCHSFTPEVWVIDVRTRQLIQKVPVTSPFCPNLAATADGREVWITHKDVGKVTVLDAQSYRVLDVLETGPVTNHVNFAGEGGGTRVGGAAAGAFAYVTVGGENVVKVYRRSDRARVATIPVGPMPHGVWPSGDGSRVYVGLQEADAVAVLDTRSNTKIAEIPIGQSPQALLYVPNAVPSGAGTQNLEPLRDPRGPLNLTLRGAPGAGSMVTGEVNVRSLGLVDALSVQLEHLEPGSLYSVFLAERTAAPYGDLEMVAAVRSDAKGKGSAEAIATLRRRLDPALGGSRRLLVLRGEGDPHGAPVLVQGEAAH